MRDYYKNPLKRGERPSYDELYEWFITKNLKMGTVSEHFNIKNDTLRKWLRDYNIVKPLELIQAQQKRDYQLKTGYDSPNQNPKVKQNKIKANIEKYGVDNYAKTQEFKIKSTQTCQEKYGVDNAFQMKETREKHAEAMHRKSKEFHEKVDPIREAERLEKQRIRKEQEEAPFKLLPKELFIQEYIENNLSVEEMLEKYDISVGIFQKLRTTYNVIKPNDLKTENMIRGMKEFYTEENTKLKYEKSVKTNLERYGFENPSQSPEVKEKFKQTSLERYGVDHPMKCPEIIREVKRSNLEKYGHDWYMSSEDFKEKSKETMLEMYGCENFLKSPEKREEIEQKRFEQTGYRNGSQNPEVKAKITESVRNTTGYDYNFQRPEVIEKSHSPEVMQQKHETRKRNGTSKVSKIEIQILELIKSKFPDVDPQHREARYPFACDFYIPSLDIFIEYQGHEGHGGMPYDPTNLEHLAIVEKWKEKSKELNFKNEPKLKYLSYITTWTERDPLKRETAKKNNLNWIEFFTLEDFLEWFENF